jgi:uncharacterized protein (DUF2147 family)
MKVWTFFATVLLTATTAFGAGPSDILGSWKTAGGDSRLEFFRCGEKICGKIVWLKEPAYLDKKDGPVGTTKVDRKNPNPALRKRPILGLQVMKGLKAKGNNRWGMGPATIPKPARATSVKCSWYRPVDWNCAAISGFLLSVATSS